MKEIINKQALELWEKIKKRPEFDKIVFYLDLCCKFTEFHAPITTVTIEATFEESGDLIKPHLHEIESAFASELKRQVALQLQVRGEDPLSPNLLEASKQGSDDDDLRREAYGFIFRSASEVRLADVLQKRKVLYFPNAKGSLLKKIDGGHYGVSEERRVNQEPDFLVCYEGYWGILECDGPKYHDPSVDRARDMLWKANGIKFIKRFSATECYNNPEKVVDGFLKSLKENDE